MNFIRYSIIYLLFNNIKDKSQRIKKLEKEQKQQKQKHTQDVTELKNEIADLKNEIADFKYKMRGLENRMGHMEKWSAKPCLFTALETVFKQKMGILTDNKDYLWKLLDDSIENEVLNNTGIAKAAWWKMYSFLNSDPSRNHIIHHDIPDANLLEICYERLKDDMDRDVKSSFLTFLSLLYKQ